MWWRSSRMTPRKEAWSRVARPSFRCRGTGHVTFTLGHTSGRLAGWVQPHVGFSDGPLFMFFMEEQGGVVVVTKLRPGKREFTVVCCASQGALRGQPLASRAVGSGAVLCLAGHPALQTSSFLQMWTSVAKHHDAQNHLHVSLVPLGVIAPPTQVAELLELKWPSWVLQQTSPYAALMFAFSFVKRAAPLTPQLCRLVRLCPGRAVLNWVTRGEHLG